MDEPGCEEHVAHPGDDARLVHTLREGVGHEEGDERIHHLLRRVLLVAVEDIDQRVAKWVRHVDDYSVA